MYTLEFLHNYDFEFSVILITVFHDFDLVSGDFSFPFYAPKLPWPRSLMDCFFAWAFEVVLSIQIPFCSQQFMRLIGPVLSFVFQ